MCLDNTRGDEETCVFPNRLEEPTDRIILGLHGELSEQECNFENTFRTDGVVPRSSFAANDVRDLVRSRRTSEPYRGRREQGRTAAIADVARSSKLAGCNDVPTRRLMATSLLPTAARKNDSSKRCAMKDAGSWL